MMGYPQFNVGHRENLGTWVPPPGAGMVLISLDWWEILQETLPILSGKKNMEDGAPQIWSLVYKPWNNPHEY